MKKILAVLLTIALLFSLVTVSFAVDDGHANIDTMTALDADMNKVSGVKPSGTNFGDLSGKGVAYIKLQGWYASNDEFTDIGWGTNDGEIHWGCMYERGDLNSTNTGRSFFSGLNVSFELGEGSCVTSVFVKFVEDDEILEILSYEYINKTIGITTDREIVVMENGEFVMPLTISIADKNESGKDWIGLYPAKTDLTKLSADDTMCYWTYVTGSTMDVTLESLKSAGAKPVEPGDYVIALCENDGYKVLESTKISIKTKEQVPGALAYTGDDLEWSGASDSDENGNPIVTDQGGATWVSTIGLTDEMEDPTEYPYGVLEIEYGGPGGHVGFYEYSGGAKMTDDTPLQQGLNKYTFSVSAEMSEPSFPFFNGFEEAVIHGLYFFSTYEEYAAFMENGTIWETTNKATPVPATPTPKPTEAPATPTKAPTEAPKQDATEVPSEATAKPADDTTKTEEKKEESNSSAGLIIGIVAAVVVVAVVVIIVVKKKKK